MVVLLLSSQWRWKESVLIRAQTKNDDDTNTTTPGTYGVWDQENTNFLGIVEAPSKKSYPNLPSIKSLYTCLVHDGVYIKAKWTSRGASGWHVGHHWVFDRRERQHYWCWHQLICNCFKWYATQNFGKRLPTITRKHQPNKARRWRTARVQSWADVPDETDWEPSIKCKLSR